jgi:anthranilate phosphoribosyltransferase
MAGKMARVLAAGGAIRALVVHGADGLDELSTTGPSLVYDWDATGGPGWGGRAAGAGGGAGSAGAGGGAGSAGADVVPVMVDPSALGLPPARVDELAGGDAATNAGFARRVLAGESGPHRDIVLLNAAAGLMAAGVCADLEAGLGRAAAAIDDGRAEAALERLVTVSCEAARRA